jgi:hypothetical protein
MTAALKPVTLFYSYAHADEKLRDELAKHLSLLRNEGYISDWHDRLITLGDEWVGQINEYLASAEIILLLISADFMASRYCYDIELTRALQRHATGLVRVIPIILRPVDWQSAPFGKLQALPKDGKAVTTWHNQDEAFVNIAKGIRYAIKELRGSQPAMPVILPIPAIKPEDLAQAIEKIRSEVASATTAPPFFTTMGSVKIEPSDFSIGDKPVVVQADKNPPANDND